jgi:hypothetical protein
MNDTKPWYTSVGVWGAIVTILTPALRLLKIELDAQAQADLAGMLFSAATIIAGAVALYGRLRAAKRIAGVPVAPPPGSAA